MQDGCGPAGQSERRVAHRSANQTAPSTRLLFLNLRARRGHNITSAGRKEGLVIVNGDIFVWECRLSSSLLLPPTSLASPPSSTSSSSPPLSQHPRPPPPSTTRSPLPVAPSSSSLSDSLQPESPSTRVSIELLRLLLRSCPFRGDSTPYFFPNFFVAPFCPLFPALLFFFPADSCARSPTRPGVATRPTPPAASFHID